MALRVDQTNTYKHMEVISISISGTSLIFCHQTLSIIQQGRVAKLHERSSASFLRGFQSICLSSALG